MSTVLTNGIIIPDNGSRNWGGDLANNWNIIDLNVGYMTDIKNRVTTLENSVAENSANIQINASNISALQTSKQDVIEDLETIRAGASAGATAVQPNVLSNYVDLNSEQTINGAKTFSKDIRISKTSPFVNVFASGYIKGQTPASNAYSGVRFFDDPNSGSANHITGGFEIEYNQDGYNKSYISSRNYSGETHKFFTVGLRVPNDDTRSIDFLPSVNGIVNLGTSTNKWKTLNEVNPGALSLPSSANKIEISIPQGESTYTPPSDGWLQVAASGQNFLLANGLGMTSRFFFSPIPDLIYKEFGTCVPCRKGIVCNIYVDASTTGYFLPCQGNV